MNLLRMTKELFSDSFGRAIESVKTKIYRDSASGLDINVYPTKDEIVKKTLDKNKKDNEIDRLLGLSAERYWENIWWYLHRWNKTC
nr:hypothetical protein [Mycoplasmopsis bovis]